MKNVVFIIFENLMMFVIWSDIICMCILVFLNVVYIVESELFL